MVYEIECAECGSVIDYGSGDEPSELPDNAIEWNDGYYCRTCVKKFVRLGSGKFGDRIEYLEDRLKEVCEELNIHFRPPDK